MKATQDIIARARAILDLEIESIQEVRDIIDGGFCSAVSAILETLNSGSKIVVTGVGKNLHIAEKLAGTLASTGSTSVVLHPTQAMHGDMGIMLKGDVMLALSYSGESEELLALIPAVHRHGVKIIAITGNTKSRLASLSDIVVPVTVSREACPFNMAPTCSTTATLALGDALAIVLLEARGFKREDYAKLHPGGAIGRALLLKVADIMRTGESLVAVSPETEVREALIEMTRVRSGSACVVAPTGALLGIFTDGDLRRNLSDCDNLLGRPIAEVMTADPVSVEPEKLAVDVLGAYESHRIDDLPVVDEHDKLVGVIDIQDLPRLKIL